MRYSRIALCVPLLVSIAASAVAQTPVRTEISLGAGYFNLGNPIWRKPSGHEEVTLGQSGSSYGPRIGFMVSGTKAGLGAELFGFSKSFPQFAIPRYESAQDTVKTTYDSPTYTLANMDLTLHWFPAPNTLSFYGLLGMAMRKEAFTISGAFGDWDNGSKSYSEFVYSFGVGARLAVLKRVALNADYRWIPGDNTTECSDVGKLIKNYGSYGLYECNTNLSSYTTHYSKLASVGLQLIVGGKTSTLAASRQYQSDSR